MLLNIWRCEINPSFSKKLKKKSVTFRVRQENFLGEVAIVSTCQPQHQLFSPAQGREDLDVDCELTIFTLLFQSPSVFWKLLSKKNLTRFQQTKLLLTKVQCLVLFCEVLADLFIYFFQKKSGQI